MYIHGTINVHVYAYSTLKSPVQVTVKYHLLEIGHIIVLH